MTAKMSESQQAAELEKQYYLFSNHKEYLDLEDLRLVAKDLGEVMTDDELREMIFEANKKNRDGVVAIGDFISILEKDAPQWKPKSRTEKVKFVSNFKFCFFHTNVN